MKGESATHGNFKFFEVGLTHAGPDTKGSEEEEFKGSDLIEIDFEQAGAVFEGGDDAVEGIGWETAGVQRFNFAGVVEGKALDFTQELFAKTTADTGFNGIFLAGADIFRKEFLLSRPRFFGEFLEDLLVAQV